MADNASVFPYVNLQVQGIFGCSVFCDEFDLLWGGVGGNAEHCEKQEIIAAFIAKSTAFTNAVLTKKAPTGSQQVSEICKAVGTFTAKTSVLFLVGA